MEKERDKSLSLSERLNEEESYWVLAFNNLKEKNRTNYLCIIFAEIQSKISQQKFYEDKMK